MKDQILQLAKQAGLCKEWQGKILKDSSLKNLCDMYFAGDDWAMEHDFPSIEILRDYKGKSEIYGLFTDYVGMPNNLSKTAFFGKSKVQLTYTGFSVSRLILRHHTEAKIRVCDNAKLIINILDNAKLDIECIDTAWVEVFSYSNENIKILGDVTIHKSKF